MPLPKIKLPPITLPAINFGKMLRLVAEGLMALVAVTALLVALFIGRLMYGPLTTTSLTPLMEKALSAVQYGIKAKVEQSTMLWDKERRHVVLNLGGVQFVDMLDQKVADIPQVIVVFSPLGYLSPAHSPWIITMRQPQLHLRIDDSGSLRLGALQTGETNILEKDEDTPLTTEGLKAHLQDIVNNARHAVFGILSNLSVEDAGITLIDEPRNEMWHFQIPELSMKRAGHNQEGSAVVHITKDAKQTDLGLNLRYDGHKNLFYATLSFRDLEPGMLTAQRIPFKVADYITSRMSGAITVSFSNELALETGLFELELSPGTLNIPAYYPAPLNMTKASLVATYTAATKTLLVDPLSLELEKATIGGTASMKFEGDARSIAVRAKVSKLRLEDAALYWPEKVAVNPRAWILDNMQKGLLDEATVDVDMSVPGDDIDNAKLDRLNGTISLKDVDLRYWKPLPKLTKVSATSKYDAHHFDIDVLGGEMGSIRLKPSHVDISGLDADNQIAAVDAHLEGPAQDVLKVLNLPPLGYADKVHVVPDRVSGTMEGVLKTSFPLLDDLLLDQMNIAADVKLKNLGITKIVDLLEITGGDITLGVDTKTLTIDGDAKLNGVPAHVSWDEKFSGAAAGEPLSHGVAHATTGAESAQRFGVDFVASSDPMPITVIYDRYPDLSRLSVAAEAKGAALDIPDIWYHKDAGAPASIQVALEWGGGPPPRLTHIDLTGQNLNVKGSGSFDSTGKKLAKLTLDPFIADNNKAKITFVRGSDGVPEWTVTGETLDLQGLLAPPPEQKNVAQQVQATAPNQPASPLRLDMQVARMITGPKTGLGNTRIKGTRDRLGWSMLNISTATPEGTPFSLNIAPSGGFTMLQASTPNLGNFLRALDMTDTFVGGKMNMDGKSQPNDALRTLFGHIKISDFNVRDMPFLLKLLGAISPDGLGVLGSQSLHFGEFVSEYLWNRDSFVFTKANTATGTLGLTAAGRVDLIRNRIDMEGQVIPVYFISKIIGAIPIVGDLLTGGNDHGIFAATYQVKGPLARPNVSVNPVSVLAPGIIRDILFTNPDITKEKSPPAAAAKPIKAK